MTVLATDLLRAEGISKSFGPVRALADVSLHVAGGEVVALAGENGSGKSTLVRIIAGVQTADAGTVQFGGRRVSFASPRLALAAGICLVSQEPTLVPDLSVAENILLGEFSAPGRLVRRASLYDRAAAYLDEVGLPVDPRRRTGSLGVGELELVELAKALAHSPRLLILDEVTSRLPDPGRLFEVVRRSQDRGVATIFITHRLREIRQLAHRAVVLRDGRLAAELPRDQLTDERIAAVMVGRELGDFFHKRPVAAGQPRLQVRGLVTDRAPHPVSVTVREGEIVGLAGLVGAGRSELLETVGGARHSRGGTVLVDGAPVRIRSPRQAQRAGIVLVPEDRFSQGLSRWHSVRDNLATPWLSGYRLVTRPSRTGGRMPLHCTATGKVLLAFAPSQVADMVLAAPLPRRTPRTVVAPGLLRTELAAVRANGYALESEETRLGYLSVAAPVIDASLRVCAAVSVAAPTARAQLARLVPAVRDTAGQISAKLRTSEWRG